MKRLGIVLIAAVMVSSCVSKKEFAKLESIKDEIATENSNLESDLSDCKAEVAGLKADLAARDQALAMKDANIRELNERVNDLRSENKEYFTRIGELMNNKDITTDKFLEMIAAKDEQLEKATQLANKLNYKIQVKDSINLALVLNLRKSLEDINDEDINIEVRGEKVFVSISDKMLFKSGSSVISSTANNVLGKVARILNDHDHIDIVVEGHTDNVPINTGCVKDNWDLSVDRSTAIVRALQTNHKVDPKRLTAAGRSEYMPKADNATSDGRAQNRRTEIIITPRMDEFMNLYDVKDDSEEGGTDEGGTEGGGE